MNDLKIELAILIPLHFFKLPETNMIPNQIKETRGTTGSKVGSYKKCLFSLSN